MIHFEDVPAWKNFDPPDNVHIDVREQKLFTGALIDELQRRGMLLETRSGRTD